MFTKWIDVWRVETFDNDLYAELSMHEKLIYNYMTTDKKNFLEREAADRTQPNPFNPYIEDYYRLVENEIMPRMEARTIRAWHYTRLTADEVSQIWSSGIYPSTMGKIQQRLNAQVSAGVLSSKEADDLFAGSPFHNKEQYSPRSDRFWLTSHPIQIDDSGVTLLLGNWGGESVYFWLKDPVLKKIVAGIGKPRVLEIAVPLDTTKHIYSAAEAVVATFGRRLGCEPDRCRGFDLYTTQALGSESVIAVHTEGEPNFIDLARGYPSEFIGRTD
jgi:hypothetical protein